MSKDVVRPLFGRDGDLHGFGRLAAAPIPPSNTDAEIAFLGALLANNKVLDRAPFLEPHHFAHPVHGRIFEEARRLIGERKIADSITLKTVFEQSDLLEEVGGPAYLSHCLANMVVGIINAGDYAQVVRNTWLQRELIDIGERLVTEARGIPNGDAVDPVKIAMEAVALIDKVASGITVEATTSLGVAAAAAIKAMKDAKENKKLPGISTGFHRIDERLGGLEPQLVYVLGGRPGMGKSALGHQIAINAAKSGVGVLEWSLEMSALQLGRRALAAESGVPLFVMKRGIQTDDQERRLDESNELLQSLPLTIDDTAGQTPRMLATKARAAKRKHGLGLIMLDHLNLTRPDDADAKHGATFAIEKASGTMLQIAKDCNVAVLLLTQLNRGVEGRDDKRPGLQDLRQSGSIEQDAFAVGLVYREEYYLQNGPEKREGEDDKKYNKRFSDWNMQRNEVAGKAEIIWGKVRDGQPGTDVLRFDGKTTSFSER